MQSSSRALYNLRAFVILIVVGFHSVLAYLGSGPIGADPFDDPPYRWVATPIIDSERWFGFDLFCAFNYVYLMHFMFFLSGLFVWPGLMRKGSKAFLQERVIRLGVPFLIGVYLLMPVAHYPVYRVTATDPSWSAFWQHWTALPFWTSGPLWFLWFLLALDACAAGLYRFVPGVGQFIGRLSATANSRPIRYYLGLVAISALAYVPLAAIYDPWEWVRFGPFGFQPAFSLHYLVFFFAGMGAGMQRLEEGMLGREGMLARHCGRWVALGLGTFLLWIVPTAFVTQGYTIVGLRTLADFGLVFATAANVFALTGMFVRFAADRSAIAESLSINAYGIYLLHYPFVVWLQYAMLGVALPAIAKAAVVFGGTLSASWALSVGLSRFPIGARLIGAEVRGAKPERANAPAE
jgi:glucans biosynthesis protein C